MLKKSLKQAILISVVINAVCLITNLICANTINKIPFGLSLAGGDCIEHIGFGINLLEIFAMSSNGHGSNNHVEISFNLISLLGSLAIVFVIVLILALIVNKIRNNNS